MPRLFISLVILYISLTKTQGAKRTLHLEISNYTCHMYGKRLKQLDCELNKIAKNHYGFNENFIFERDMANDWIVRVRIDIKQGLMSNYFRFIDVKMGACEALNYEFKEKYPKALMAEYKRSTNLPSSCPFKGNYPYKMNNFSMSINDFPAYMPDCSFIFVFDWLDVNTLFASNKITGSVVSK